MREEKEGEKEEEEKVSKEGRRRCIQLRFCWLSCMYLPGRGQLKGPWPRLVTLIVLTMDAGLRSVLVGRAYVIICDRWHALVILFGQSWSNILENR
ncbi:unnamed protein product [Dovyalis caffra]|uniref:Uncharacterized protein n=1 Tax=Dovyalis caffra TaxID=77055 RepID=A0AAV1SG24_9ROSI|nr:unnamed protein product [Dovyalis caffra]